MRSGKLMGYVFIFLAVILSLAILGQIPELFRITLRVADLFTGRLDGFQSGQVFGNIIYWVLHIGATIALWQSGIRRMNKQL